MAFMPPVPQNVSKTRRGRSMKRLVNCPKSCEHETAVRQLTEKDMHMKAYSLNPQAEAPTFTAAGVVIAECYAVVKRAKKPVTVAAVRAKVEAHFGEPCAVRHALVRLVKLGAIQAHDLPA